jgi:hypothetical protein
VEVTPDEVRLIQGEQCLNKVVLTDLKAKPQPRIGGRIIEVRPKLASGGLGLVLHNGRGSFRHVVIQPLP